MPADSTLPLPRTFDRYALFDFIGRGGTAEAYLARQKTELGVTRRCVVKQIVPELASDPTFSDMLIYEAKLAARLNHANVVQVFDLGREGGEGGRLFIAMEYVEGFDLNALLRRCSRDKVPLPFELALHVVAESLKGLDYAHRRADDNGRPLEIVHRDVSPSNLLVSFEGEVKVCDFGIAHANDTIGATRIAGHELQEALKGKAGYMSPEHARRERIDARADVFAAGIILWELAAGRRLYRTTDGGPSLLEQAREAKIPELPQAGLPAEDGLRTILSKALATDRAARYGSASAMLRDLREYAVRAKLTTSPLQLGNWLTDTFGDDIVARRRARERAAAALEKGPLLVLKPIGAPSAATSSTSTPASPIGAISEPLSTPRTSPNVAPDPSSGEAVFELVPRSDPFPLIPASDDPISSQPASDPFPLLPTSDPIPLRRASEPLPVVPRRRGPAVAVVVTMVLMALAAVVLALAHR